MIYQHAGKNMFCCSNAKCPSGLNYQISWHVPESALCFEMHVAPMCFYSRSQKVLICGYTQ